MAVRNPRTRLISFRLSQDEYRSLQALCDALEARSISAFVRAAICGVVQTWLVDVSGRAAEPAGDGSSGCGYRDTVLARLNPRSDARDEEVRRLAALSSRS